MKLHFSLKNMALFISTNTIIKKSVDQQWDTKFQDHLSKIQKEKDLIIEEQKKRKQEELKKYKALLAEINSLT